jgi:hypothetical protein
MMGFPNDEIVPIELRSIWYFDRSRDFKGLRVLNLRGFNWYTPERHF